MARRSGYSGRSSGRAQGWITATVVLGLLLTGGVIWWRDNHGATTNATAPVQPPAVGKPAANSAAGTFLPPASASRTQLDTLKVAYNQNSQSYQRDAFGPGWSGRGAYPKLADGCTARDDVLKRDLKDLKIGDTNPCIVFSGVLDDPYTGKSWPYSRYAKSQIELDHVVALGAAWRTGASGWDPARRQQFANDIDNLLAVDKKSNQDKSSKTPDQWKPANQEFWCDYARRWIAVKTRYGLTVTDAEKKSLTDMLSVCPAA